MRVGTMVVGLSTVAVLQLGDFMFHQGTDLGKILSLSWKIYVIYSFKDQLAVPWLWGMDYSYSSSGLKAQSQERKKKYEIVWF